MKCMPNLGDDRFPRSVCSKRSCQALYTIRSENLLVESLHYDLLFRWFLDLNMTDSIWDNSTFSKNQERLLQHRTADLFFCSVAELARGHGWVSDEHFTVCPGILKNQRLPQRLAARV